MWVWVWVWASLLETPDPTNGVATVYLFQSERRRVLLLLLLLTRVKQLQVLRQKTARTDIYVPC